MTAILEAENQQMVDRVSESLESHRCQRIQVVKWSEAKRTGDPFFGNDLRR